MKAAALAALSAAALLSGCAAHTRFARPEAREFSQDPSFSVRLERYDERDAVSTVELALENKSDKDIPVKVSLYDSQTDLVAPVAGESSFVVAARSKKSVEVSFDTSKETKSLQLRVDPQDISVESITFDATRREAGDGGPAETSRGTSEEEEGVGRSQ